MGHRVRRLHRRSFMAILGSGAMVHKCPMLAIRQGKWKLLMNPDRSRVELYDIPSDPTLPHGNSND